MQRERLTLARIAAFNCPEGKQQAFIWDTDAPRLAVRATAGAKSFIFETKLNRQTIRRTIGDVKNWKLDEAREEARRLQTLVDKGADPRELDREQTETKARAKAACEASKQDAENRKRYTLKALCEAYGNLLEANGKTQSARQARSILKCHVLEAYPDIAALPAQYITAHQIAAMVRKVAEQGKDRAAGILRSYLSAAFNAARKAPFDAKLPAALIAYGVESNPVEPVSTIAVQRGDRTLTADELKSYMATLSDDDLSDQALKLALFAGGQRMAQLLRAKVSDYDEDTQTLRLWDGKGKRSAPREHLLPLAPKAADIVEYLSERAQALKTPLLFSSFGSKQLVETTPGKRATAICKAMGGEAFDLRDMRRTCETMLAGMSISKDTRAQLLSHGLSGVQAAHYDRHSYTDEKRAALVAWEQRLDDIATGKKVANVVQMKRRNKSAA
jgi:integrase